MHDSDRVKRHFILDAEARVRNISAIDDDPSSYYTAGFFNGLLLASRSPETARAIMSEITSSGIWPLKAIAAQDQWIAAWLEAARE